MQRTVRKGYSMKRSMKKQALLLSTAMLLGLAGCKKDDTEDTTPTSQEGATVAGTAENGTEKATADDATKPGGETKPDNETRSDDKNGAGDETKASQADADNKESSKKTEVEAKLSGYSGANLPDKSDYKANTPLTDTSDKYMLADESKTDAVITFSGTEATVTGDKKDAVPVDEENGICVATITKGGVYRITGSSENGRVNVDAGSDKVWLILDGADLTADSAPIYVEQADKTILTLAKDSENKLADRSRKEGSDESDEDVDGVIYSKDDLIINGSGSLTIKSNYDKGIHGKDDLRLRGGKIKVEAVGDAIQGNDSIEISAGEYTLTTQKDGFVTKTTDKDGKGYISINGGTFTVTAEGDGFTAATDLEIKDGAFAITTGGGAGSATAKSGNGFGGWGRGQSTLKADSTSSKGLKAEKLLTVSGGIFTIDSKDDAVHCDDTIRISGAPYMELSTGDDAIHAEESLTLDEYCYIQVQKSYEGYESANIYVKGGWHRITASDDGLNASGGTSNRIAMEPGTEDDNVAVRARLTSAGYMDYESSDDSGQGGSRIRRPEGPGGFGTIGGGNQVLEISGGYLYVNAGGDGLDSNGKLSVSGGITVVAGPTDNGNGPLDCGEGNTVSITGGILLAAGSTGMMERPETNYVASTKLAASADTQITIADADGNVLVSFVTPKKAQGLIASAAGKSDGYKIYTGGTVNGTFNADQVCIDGTIRDGKEVEATDITGFEGFGGRGGRNDGNGGVNPFKGLPDDLPEQFKDLLPDDLPDDWQEFFKDKLPEDWQDRIGEGLPDGWDEFFEDKLPEDWQERFRDALPDDLPERFKDALPESRDGKNGDRTPKNDRNKEDKSDAFTA